jgi:hypothetical protein
MNMLLNVNGSELGDGERLYKLGEDEYPEWDAFVQAHAQGTPYHLSGWRGFVEEVCPHASGDILVIRDSESNVIRAGIPLFEAKSFLLGKRWISSPFGTLGGVLASSDEDLGAMLRGIRALWQDSGCRRVELRGVRPSACLESSEFRQVSGFLHHYLALPESAPELLPLISRGVRRCIVRAEAAGVELRDGHSPDTLAALASVHQDTRRRLGLPVFPQGFYAALARHLPSSATSLIVAVRNEKVLGILMNLKLGKWVIGEHVGVTAEGRSLGVNQFLIWKAIEKSIGDGHRFYSFGRTAVDNPGLVHFKRAWRATEEPLATLVLPADAEGGNDPVRSKLVKDLARWTFRSMPRPIAQVVGRCFYRHWA